MKKLLAATIAILATLSPVCAADNNETPSKNIVKITMLSLGSGSSRFTYERALNEKFSAEITYGAIGMGWDIMNHSNANGAIIKLAPKYNFKPQKSANSWLAGAYIKPEFIYANFDYNVTKAGAPDLNTRKRTIQSALLAECGYQLVAWNWFSFDIYTGLGPTWGGYNANNYYHGFMIFPAGGRIAYTAGYRIGIAF